MKTKLIITIASSIIAGSGFLSGATLINLAGGYFDGTPVLISGPGVVGEAGDFWNTFNTGSHDPMSNLIDSKNNTSSISFTSVGINQGGGGISATTGFFSQSETGYFANFGSPVSYSITGLTDYIGTSFQLIVFSMVGTNGSNTLSTFELSGGTSSATVSGFDNRSDIPLQEGLSYGVLTGVVNGAGEINFTQTAQTGSTVYFNGFQLSLVPEPSSYAAVFGAASIGLIALRRKRK